MKPYLAIILDSFRAALANRVLYVLLGLITLLLVAVMPLSYTESLDWELDRRDLFNSENVARKLVGVPGQSRDSQLEKIWQSMSGEFQERLTTSVQAEVWEQAAEESRPGPPPPDAGPQDQVVDDLVEALNEVIADTGFCQPEEWKNIPLASEAKGLLETFDSLTEVQKKRLNRLLVSYLFAGGISRGELTVLEFYYGPFDVTTTSIPHQQIAQYIGEYTPWIFDKFIMSIGLLIAIVVTSNMIPEMFDPGSLNLLLSKPVSRSGLLIAKFIGGCVFTTICATYLLLGLWIWFGFRLGVWENSILYSIPLYLLVYAIYFSVSTLAGIRFRSANLSVVLTAVFWAVCFLMGSVYFFCNTRMENIELTQGFSVGERVYAIDAVKSLYEWSETDGQFVQSNSVLDMENAGPGEIAFEISTYLDDNINLPAQATTVVDEIGGLAFGARILLQPGRPNMSCVIADVNEMEFEKFGKYPQNMVRLLPGPDGVVAVTRRGDLYRIRRDLFQALKSTDNSEAKMEILRAAMAVPELEEQADSLSENEARNSLDASDVGKPESAAGDRGTPGELFEKLEVGLGVSIGSRGSDLVDLNWERNEIVVYRRQKLTVLAADAEYGYLKKAEVEIDTGFSANMSCRVRAQGDSIVLAFGNGEIIHVDRESLQETRSFLPENRSKMTQVAMSRDGKWFAANYGNETLWLYDIESQQMNRANVYGQKSISGISFDQDSQLWVADRTDRLTLYDPQTLDVVKQISPAPGYFKMAYRYLVRPVYLVFPKPSEVYKLVTHLSSSRNTTYNRNVDLANAQEAMNPWAPLWSGVGFMLTMLAIGCVIFNYSDY